MGPKTNFFIIKKLTRIQSHRNNDSSLSKGLILFSQIMESIKGKYSQFTQAIDIFYDFA
jgi:hypothetical protein